MSGISYRSSRSTNAHLRPVPAPDWLVRFVRQGALHEWGILNPGNSSTLSMGEWNGKIQKGH